MTNETKILLNILNSKTPHLDLLELDKIGVLKDILPELTALKGVDEVNGQRHKDNFIHTIDVIRQTSELTNDPWLIFAAIFHDIGKAKTKRFIKGIGWSFHLHEELSAKMINSVFKKFELDRKEYDRVHRLILWHGHIKNLNADSSDSSLRRFDKDISPYLEDMILFCKCDITTKFKDKRDRFCVNVDYIYKRIIELREFDKKRVFQIPVSGEVIMKDFGIKPSKLLGDIKEEAKRKILAGELTDSYEDVYNWIKLFLKEKV